MKLTFIGAAHEVTGSCHYLEACGKRILIDCGLEQGPDLYENQDLPTLPSDIDYLLLTHAHIDHSGRIPLLVKQGFQGDIICTFATSDLCSIFYFHQRFWVSKNRKAKCRKKGNKGDTEMLNTHTLPFSILLKHLSGLLSHERIHI